MTGFWIIFGIVIYLTIAWWATRFMASQDFFLADSFKPMTLGDAVLLLAFVFTPLSLLSISVATYFKAEQVFEGLPHKICEWTCDKIVRLASWMFLPRKKDSPL